MANWAIPSSQDTNQDARHARLVRNIEQLTALIFEAFEDSQSCKVIVNLQEGEIRGMSKETHYKPVA